MDQKFIEINDNYDQIDIYLKQKNCKKIFVACGNSMYKNQIGTYFLTLEERLGIKVTYFSEFTPNPTYEAVIQGINRLKKERCQIIVAVGGGSAIDVAKCIKLFYWEENLNKHFPADFYLNDIELIAIPTTAGTGSESTNFAVIYYQGEKKSVCHSSILPNLVVMDPRTLETLPMYQRKVTMLDALCHAMESFWSVHSTKESWCYAMNAIYLILENMKGYLSNTKQGNFAMLKAANIAGKAINITQTTAGHAMSYKLTSLYDIAHGHAVALCNSKLLPYLFNHLELCKDPRGKKQLEFSLQNLSTAFGCRNIEEVAEQFDHLLFKLELEVPKVRDEDYEILRSSVNVERLKNYPIELSLEVVDELYHKILSNRR